MDMPDRIIGYPSRDEAVPAAAAAVRGRGVVDPLKEITRSAISQILREAALEKVKK